MTKERRLGRGLEALLGRPIDRPKSEGQPPASPAPASDPAAEGAEAAPATDRPTLRPFPAANEPEEPAADSGFQLSVYEIDSNPFQPRRDFDEAEIQQLADSLKEHGLLQPLVVRRVGNRYQLVAGERRLRAAIKAGWKEVPARLKEADDREMAELAIVENLQRKDLNPLEKAASFQKYLQRYGTTQEELARRLNIDRSTVSNLIRLLDLPETVQDALRRGRITQGHARALLPLGDEARQNEFCQRIQSEGLSVRAIESLVHETLHAAPDGETASSNDGTTSSGGTSPRAARSEHLAALEQQLRGALGTKVELRQTAKGRGRIVIHFSSHEEFDRLHAHLCGHSRPQREAG